jgi:hypothetical protein
MLFPFVRQNFAPDESQTSGFDQFIASGAPGAEKLKSLQGLYGPAGFMGWSNAGGEDMNPLVAQYTDWIKKVNDSTLEHQQFVALTNDRPGRNQTIIATPDKKTVLG